MKSPHVSNGIYRPPEPMVESVQHVHILDGTTDSSHRRVSVTERRKLEKKRLDAIHLRWEENEQGKGNLPKGRRGGINKDDRHLKLDDGSDPVPWDVSSTKLLEILGLTRAEGMAIWHAFDASISDVNIDGKAHPDDVLMLNRLGFVTALDTDRDALMNMIFHRYLPHGEKQMNFRAYLFAIFDICSMSVPHFYEMLWEMFDKDKDGVLTPPEVAELFHSLLQGGLGTRANLSELANRLYEDLARRSSDEGQTITGPVFVSFMKDHDELTMPLFEIQRKLGMSALGNRFWEKTRMRRKRDSDAEENMAYLRYLIRENVIMLPARPAFRHIPQPNPVVTMLRSLVPRKVKPEFDYGAEELDRDAQGEVVGRRISLHMPQTPQKSTGLSRAMSNLTSKFRTSVAPGKKAPLPPLKVHGTSLMQARRRQERQSRYQMQQRQMSSVSWGSAASPHGQTSPTGAGTVLSSPRGGAGNLPSSPKGEVDRPTTATALFRTVQSAEYATMPPPLEAAEPQKPQSPPLPGAAERRALASSRSMSSKKGLGRLNFSDEKEDIDSKRCLSGRAGMQITSREFAYQSPRIAKHVRSVTVLKP